MKEKLQNEFQSRFGKKPEHIFFCPGRVNLIGEHLDYNGGSVLPCAIREGTYLAVSKNIDKILRFQNLDFPEKAQLHLQQSYSKTGKGWFDYPLGVIHHFTSNRYPVSGLDMLFTGNLPVGAGLSSSASVEVLMAFALDQMFASGISLMELAVISKKTENEFIGVNCGIMDQVAVALGRRGNALLLNCETLNYEYIPFRTGDYELVIINTNKQRLLVDSKYNERFTECGLALKALKKVLKVQNLCEVDPAAFEAHRHLINNPKLEKRALHVITESRRVKEAAMALQNNDLNHFGQLLFDSHRSLKEWYEVTGEELDTLVDFCKGFDGCIGARMTGAGFGGCALALVKSELYNDFSGKLIQYYKEKIGYPPALFTTTSDDGVRSI